MAKLFVNGVNAETPIEALMAVFSLCGEVTDIYIHPSRGFAFVTMADAEGASQAIKELNGQEIGYAKTLRVQKDHGGGKGGNRHGGRSGGDLRKGLGDDGFPSWSSNRDGIVWMALWDKLHQKKDPQIMA